MKNKLYFAVVFLFVLAGTMIYQEEFPRFLFCFLLLFTAALFCKVSFLAKRIEARMKLPDNLGTKNGDIAIQVEIVNKSCLPAPEIEVELSCSDLYSGGRKVLRGKAMADSGGRAVLVFHLTSAYCGILSFGIEKIRVSDYFGIFHREGMYQKRKKELPVLPDKNTEQLSLDIKELEGQKMGEDWQDNYEIRPFMQGDTIHRIHWKMSARIGDMLVREYEQEIEKRTLILLDLQNDEPTLEREKWDKFIEKTAALSEWLLMQGETHDVCWYEKETADFIKMNVGREEQLLYMLSALLRARVYKSREIKTFYKEKFADEQPDRIIRLDIEGKIIREEGEDN